MIMKEKPYVEDFEYYPVPTQPCMIHYLDHMKNKLNDWIFDWQLKEIFLLDQM